MQRRGLQVGEQEAKIEHCEDIADSNHVPRPPL